LKTSQKNAKKDAERRVSGRQNTNFGDQIPISKANAVVMRWDSGWGEDAEMLTVWFLFSNPTIERHRCVKDSGTFTLWNEQYAFQKSRY